MGKSRKIKKRFRKNAENKRKIRKLIQKNVSVIRDIKNN
jgi:hypothetical protein